MGIVAAIHYWMPVDRRPARLSERQSCGIRRPDVTLHTTSLATAARLSSQRRGSLAFAWLAAIPDASRLLRSVGRARGCARPAPPREKKGHLTGRGVGRLLRRGD